MEQPGAVLKLCERVGEEACVDGVFDLEDFFPCAFPVGGQDVAGKLTPGGGVDFVVVGAEDAELVEEFGGAPVVAAAVLELAVVVELFNHLRRDAVCFFEVIHVADFVRSEVADYVWIAEEAL